MSVIIPRSNEDDEDRLFRTYDFTLPEPSSSEIPEPTPEVRRISRELRDQYLRALARTKQIREEEAKRKSEASDSASKSGS